MKKFTIIFAFVALSIAGFAQTCATVTTGFFTQTGSTVSLTFNYISPTPGYLQLTVKCGFYVISDECIILNGSGTYTKPNLFCSGGISALTAVATGHLGSCNGAVCSQILILPPGGGPLPVVLNSFTGKRAGNNVLLNWKTESELNTKAFILEKSTGKDFEPITSLEASNLSTGSVYTYTDNNFVKGVTQYRLKMTDINGSFKYSNIVVIKGQSSVSDFTIFPNPSNGNANITITDVTEANNVDVIDASGRVIKTIVVNKNVIPLNGLQNGMYVVRIANKNTGEFVSKKLIVVN